MKLIKSSPICPSEAQEAYALKQWADFHPICSKYLIHIPNGGSRNKREAVNLRRQGVKAGVSDYFLAYPINGYHGLWIELKRKNQSLSKLSQQQQVWITLMQNVDYKGCIAWGWEDAKNLINEYLIKA